MLNLASVIEQHARRRPDAEAVVSGRANCSTSSSAGPGAGRYDGANTCEIGTLQATHQIEQHALFRYAAVAELAGELGRKLEVR